MHQSMSASWLLWLLAVLLLSQQPCSPTAAAAAAQAQASHPTRVFIDEGYFLEGDTEILRAYISASAGRLEISGESTAAFLSVKGYYVPDKWELYWTIRQACHMAFPHMKPGQLVNCIPGVQAMSLKRNFVQTWQQAYGESAFGYIPRSYLIPQQYWLWRSHMLAAATPPDTKWVLKANIHRGKGVSVVPQHQALSQALMHSTAGSSSSGSSSSSGGGVLYHNILVQSYLEPQMVIAGRSSYIRVWLLVTSITPLRAYLFKGGFAIFGKQKGNATAAAEAAAAATTAAAAAGTSSSTSSSTSTDDLIVNLWIQDRDKSPIWSLQQLEDYLNAHPEQVLPLPLSDQQQQQQQQGHRRLLEATNSAAGAGSSVTSSNGSSSSGSSGGSGAKQQQQQQQQRQQQRRTFADAWQDMQTSASLVLAASLPAMRAAATNKSAPGQGMFEYFGLDFVLDAHLKPWLLEVNAVPSMSRRKKSECVGDKATAACKLNSAKAANSSSSSQGAKGPAAAAMDDFDVQKEWFVHDMLQLLGLPVDPPAAAGSGSGSNSSSSSNGSSDGLVLLRKAAAAAAGAGIRTSAGSSGISSSGRRLLQRLKRKVWQQQQQQRRRVLLDQGQDEVGNAKQVPSKIHRHHHHHVRPRQSTSNSTPTAAATAASGSSSAAVGEMQGLHSLQWSGPVPSLKDLPVKVQEVLCSSSGSSSSSSSAGGAAVQPFACVRCLTADDLAALAAAEGELQRAGRFVPVYDLTAAHRLSSMAAGPAAGPVASVRSDDTAAAAGSEGSSSPASSSAAAAVDGAGTEYLSQNRSVWQKLYHTWLAVSSDGVGLRDLGIMKYYTTASQLAAAEKLKLSRQDYVMSAWLKVRQQGEGACGGSGGSSTAGSSGGAGSGLNAGCVAEMLKRLVGECYMSH